jgi:hypothetical protein
MSYLILFLLVMHLVHHPFLENFLLLVDEIPFFVYTPCIFYREWI